MVLFSRAPLSSPRLDELPGGCVGSLRRTSAGLAALKYLPPEAVSAAQVEHFAGLSHRLSPAFEQLNLPLADKPRSKLEREALRLISAREAGIDVSDSARFKGSLEQLNALVTAANGRWRTGWAGLMPDAGGHQIGFPPVSAVSGQLEVIRKVMLNNDRVPAVFNAARVLCLMVNCHPFTDGNGRVARTLFNFILRRGGMPDDVYVPFYEIAARSRGGYVIALRHAEIRGDWQPIMRWVVEAIGCHHRIGDAP